MKIHREGVPFRPVSITLETQEEVDQLRRLLKWGFDLMRGVDAVKADLVFATDLRRDLDIGT